MPAASHQRWSSYLRLAVCAAAVSWIAYHTKWSEIEQVWRMADKKLLLLSVLFFGPTPLCIAYRLLVLMKVHDVRLSYWQLVKATFAGNFINNTLPLGTPGGDSVKAYYIARDTPLKHEAVTVVFFDRLIGVVGLVLMSGVVVVLDWHNPAFKIWGRVIGISVALMIVGGVIYFSQRTRRLFRLDWFLSKLPFNQHVQRIDRAVMEFRAHPGRVFACLIMTNLMQLNCVVGLFICGWALGLVKQEAPAIASLPIYLAYAPIGYLAGIFPVGIMESTFQQLFSGTAGLGTFGAGFLLSLFGVRFTQLVWALPGGLVILRSRPKPEEMAVVEQPAETIGL